MTTSEFRQKVEEMGFKSVVVDEYELLVMDKYGEGWFTISFYNEEYGIGLSTMEDVYISRKYMPLLNLIIEYIDTPLLQREEVQ